ncbi:GOLPH3/VPS74 family protein [Nocardioides bruguierae]|uniref:GPP34 family phosphoprotein n=1 Tax=Nocardioides bruguierae TaxID=2945102 RepID=A0A9X2D6R1_9ACTN|nr:GPP34 family phosphoprotein [Nocardioides bruguierae]MCM0620397.1 GPP34 family phosphoprotein [Nocardioides bruguierae]
MSALVSEDLLLLLLDVDRGTVPSGYAPDLGLGGALMVDLALGGHVDLAEREGMWRGQVVVPLDGVPAPEDGLLAAALARVAEKPRSPKDAVTRLGKDARGALADRLVARGLVEQVDEKVLWLFPRTRWPEADGRHERELRAALRATLLDDADPDLRTAALVALLHAVGHVHRVVHADGVGDREVKRRAKAVADRLGDGGWPAAAVTAAATEATTAVIVAMMATAAASGGAAAASGS